MSRTFNVAVVGATGVVGSEILRLLEERAFPVGELRPFASARSAGELLEFGDASVLVRELEEDAFAGIDLALFAAPAEVAERFCPVAAAAGALCIDTSGAYSADPDVPLVVPEVNDGELARCRVRGIVASPAAATVQMALPLKALHDAGVVQRVVATTCQSVSGSGRQAIDELRIQAGELLNGRPAESSVYPHQIAFNCLPHVGPFGADGASREEQLIAGELRRLLGAAELGVAVTAVRVPVFYGDCASLNVELAGEVGPERARELFAAVPGLEVVDDCADDLYPQPVEAAGEDAVLVGRVRADASRAHALSLWVAADNVRTGAANNAVQIAEGLAECHL